MSSSSVNCSNPNTLKYKSLRCKCNRKAVIRISETDNNPNRLFYSCPQINGCNFFVWCDPIVAPTTELVPNPTPDLQELQEEVRVLREEIRVLREVLRGLQQAVQSGTIRMDETEKFVASMKLGVYFVLVFFVGVIVSVMIGK
ncbi:uncharacterized protein LOC122665987 [Telopea speciosissima]|uniref:uncharacterized protein LOC122665987 n=1 Tax=Telopea speciosissima TaxID=54955 RepID=UPI001CC40AD7|nr:uncharacterized protein LOC122665987 [Telopea speciosissima]